MRFGKTTMSRIAAKPIKMPEGAEVVLDGKQVRVTTPKGAVEFDLPNFITASLTEEGLKINRSRNSKITRSMHGLQHRLIENTLKGFGEGWSKTLELIGTGYRARVEGEDLVLLVGYSHPVKIKAPAGIKFSVEENRITVSGVDRYLVGQVAAWVRMPRPPEPYKGKGVRYVGERVRRKAGKAAKAAG